MKNKWKTMFIALLTAFQLVGGRSIGYAQKPAVKQTKTLVTKLMGQKIAERILYDRRSNFNRAMFNNANDIRTLRESDMILSNIEKHLDYAENFIVWLFDYYGTGDVGYIALKSFSFTPEEYKIAEKIYNNVHAKEIEEKKKQEASKRQEEQRQKEIRKNKEQELYDEWTENGIPVLSEKQVTNKPVIIAKTIENFNDGLNNIDYMFFYDNFIPTVQCSHWENKTKKLEFIVQVNPDKTIKLLNENSATDYHFGNLALEVSKPATYEFKELGKILSVPVKMTITITFTASRSKNDYGYALAKFDEKYGQWYFTKKDYAYSENFPFDINLNEIVKKYKFDEKKQFREDIAEQLQYLMGLQHWPTKAKSQRYIGFCEYNIEVETNDIDNKDWIKITNKAAILDSFEK